MLPAGGGGLAAALGALEVVPVAAQRATTAEGGGQSILLSKIKV